MEFRKEYFEKFKYWQRKPLIQRYIYEVLRWGSEILRSNLLNGHGKTALDVGCAYGFAVEILKLWGYDVVGVDISRHSIRQAKKICKTDFVVCDVQKLPFKSGTFDLITCFQVLEHLFYPLDAIKTMFDSCKHILICTTPNKAVEKPIKKLVRDWDKTHISLKVPGEWNACIRESLNKNFVKVESFFDMNLRVKNKLLFFKSFKLPYLGLDIRILVKR